MSIVASLLGRRNVSGSRRGSLQLEMLEPRVLLSVSAYVHWIEMDHTWDYGAPGDTLSYDFDMEVETTTDVERLQLDTPGGQSYEILKDDFWYAEGVEAYSYEEGGSGFWEIEAEFPDQAGLADFGDGWYTFTIDTPGGQEQTRIWFGIPGTANPIPQPTQQPVFASPTDGGPVGSPVTFRWLRCTDANATAVYLDVEDDLENDVIEEELSKSATSFGPAPLNTGWYNADINFERGYSGTNADGIDFWVGKGADAEIEFVIPASASDVALDIDIQQGPWVKDGDKFYTHWTSIETIPGVTSVQFHTPAGNTYTIPQMPDQKLGNVETWWDQDGDDAEWGYLGAFPNPTDLNSFGDGTYTFTFFYPGGQKSTDIWFGIPGTLNPIPQPQQEPTLIEPASGLYGRSPVTAQWDQCTDPNADSVEFHVVSLVDGQEEDYAVEEYLPKGQTSYGPVALGMGQWEVEVVFLKGQNYTGQNADGVDFTVRKGYGCRHDITVTSGPSAQYKVYGSNSFDPQNYWDWWGLQWNPWNHGFEQLGTGYGTATFDGAYDFYLVIGADRQAASALIDAITGSDGQSFDMSESFRVAYPELAAQADGAYAALGVGGDGGGLLLDARGRGLTSITVATPDLPDAAVLPFVFDVEGNDITLMAQPLASNGSEGGILGWLDGQDDTDFYRFAAQAGDTIEIAAIPAFTPFGIESVGFLTQALNGVPAGSLLLTCTREFSQSGDLVALNPATGELSVLLSARELLDAGTGGATGVFQLPNGALRFVGTEGGRIIDYSNGSFTTAVSLAEQVVALGNTFPDDTCTMAPDGRIFGDLWYSATEVGIAVVNPDGTLAVVVPPENLPPANPDSTWICQVLFHQASNSLFIVTDDATESGEELGSSVRRINLATGAVTTHLSQAKLQDYFYGAAGGDPISIAAAAMGQDGKLYFTAENQGSLYVFDGTNIDVWMDGSGLAGVFGDSYWIGELAIDGDGNLYALAEDWDVSQGIAFLGNVNTGPDPQLLVGREAWAAFSTLGGDDLDVGLYDSAGDGVAPSGPATFTIPATGGYFLRVAPDEQASVGSTIEYHVILSGLRQQAPGVTGLVPADAFVYDVEMEVPGVAAVRTAVAAGEPQLYVAAEVPWALGAGDGIESVILGLSTGDFQTLAVFGSELWLDAVSVVPAPSLAQRTLFVAEEEVGVDVLSPVDGTRIGSFGVEDLVGDVTAAPDGASVYASRWLVGIDRYSTSGTLIRQFRHADMKYGIGTGLSPDGSTLYAADPIANEIFVFNTANGALIRRFSVPTVQAVFDAAVAPTGQIFVTDIASGRVVRYDPATGAAAEVQLPGINVDEIDLLPDGSVAVAMWGAPGSIWIIPPGAFRTIGEAQVDLAISGLDVTPDTAASNALVHLSYTVTNIGQDPARGPWTDRFYLSADQTLDPDTDVLFGQFAHPANLPRGESYSYSEDVRLPNVAAGSWYVLVTADATGMVTETNETNNGASHAITISSPDLAVLDVVAPATATPGTTMTLSWRVENQGAYDAIAGPTGWFDSIWLSADTTFDPAADLRVGELAHATDLAAGDGYDVTDFALTLPAVPEDDYYVFVASDLGNRPYDADPTNNYDHAAGQTTVSVPALTLDVAQPGSFDAAGAGEYYKVTIAAGEHLLVSLDDLDNAGANELYIKLGSLPTRSSYDVRYSGAPAADPSARVLSTQAGTYYILAYSQTASGAHNILAQVLDAPEISLVAPTTVGNTGSATFCLQGALFQDGATFTLTDTGAAPPLLNSDVVDSGTALARFDLTGAQTGNWTARIQNPDLTSDTYDGAIAIVPGQPLDFSIRISGPEALRVRREGSFVIEYGSAANLSDMPLPLILINMPGDVAYGVNGGPVTLGSFGVPVVVFGIPESPYGDLSTIRSGAWTGLPTGVLMPGEQGQIDLSIIPLSSGRLNIRVSLIDDWRDAAWGQTWATSSMSSSLRQAAFPRQIPAPPPIPDTLWANFWGWFTAALGPTRGHVVLTNLDKALANPGTTSMTDTVQMFATEAWAASGGGVGFDDARFANRFMALFWATPPGVLVGAGLTPDVQEPVDPNEKIGPQGLGSAHYIPGNAVLPYTVFFENEASATAPALDVVVTDVLDDSLDLATFDFKAMGFGAFTEEIPGEHDTYFTTIIHTTNLDGSPLDVVLEAELDMPTRTVAWTFHSVDPSTGETPTGVDDGFLPPNDATGRGEGFVSYSVVPLADLDQGTEIRNIAAIVFDQSDPITTNQVDPHDPSKGTDPDKECPLTITQTIIPLATHTYPDGTIVTLYDADALDGVSQPNIAWEKSQIVKGTTDVFVDIGKLGDGVVNAITIYGDGARTADLGFIIEGSASPGAAAALKAFKDTRTGTPPLGFLLATGPVGSLVAKGGLVGGNLNGWTTEGGLDLGDLDEDGGLDDMTGLAVDASVRSVDVSGDVTGEIMLSGSLDSLRVRGNVDTEIRVDGYIKKLDVTGDWAGTVSASWIGTAKTKGTLTAALATDGAAANKGVAIGSLQAARVGTAHVAADGGIKSIKTSEWLDGQIEAAWIGSLSVSADKRLGTTGDFRADLVLDGNPFGKLTLGSAKIKGNLSNSTWDIAGNAGSITAGDATGWTLNVHSALKSLKLSEVNDTTISIDGPIGSATVAEWDTGSLEAGSLGSLKVTGSKNALLVGNFNADLTLDTPVPKKSTLGSARIAGSVGGCEWQITGDVGSVGVTGNFGGELHAQSIKSMTVKGNMDGATLDLTRGLDPLNPKLMALAKLSVTGWIESSEITSVGHIGSVTAGGMRDSSLFAGVATTADILGVGGVSDGVLDLPSLADLAPPEPVRGLVAGIKSVTIKGIKAGKLYQDSFINANIAAGSLGKVTLCYATLDNDGNPSATDVPFGLLSGTALGFRVSYKDADPTHKFTWRAGQLLPAWLGSTDLKIENG